MPSEIKPGDQVLLEGTVACVDGDGSVTVDVVGGASVYIPAEWGGIRKHVAPAPPVSGNECSPCPFCGGTGEHFVGSQAIGPCPRGCGDDVPVAPFVAPGLLAAALLKGAELINRESFQAAHDHTRWSSGECEMLDEQEAALRAELAATTAGPVALTEMDMQKLADAVPRYRIEDWRNVDPNDVAMNRVNAVLAKLNDLGYAIVRRPS